MSDDFFKYPSTPHLTVLGGLNVRSDKVLSSKQANDLLDHKLLIEEKVDGANLGISFDSALCPRFQNRGNYIQNDGGQWKHLQKWFASKAAVLSRVLTNRFILFGEWCYAQHTIHYSSLPDWFLAFDIYDREKEIFLPTTQRTSMLKEARITEVPKLAYGQFSLVQLQELLMVSHLGATKPEGIFLRLESETSVLNRAKLVRPEFIQSHLEHWSKQKLVTNCLES